MKKKGTLGERQPDLESACTLRSPAWKSSPTRRGTSTRWYSSLAPSLLEIKVARPARFSSVPASLPSSTARCRCRRRRSNLKTSGRWSPRYFSTVLSQIQSESSTAESPGRPLSSPTTHKSETPRMISHGQNFNHKLV